MVLPPEIVDPVRLAAVRATGLLDTPAEENFDRLAGLAAMLLDAPFAFVTLVDETRSFWKSCIGVEAQDVAYRQNSVEESFCQYVVATGEPLIVGDVAADPRTADNPSIVSMGVAAWAGYPLLGPRGAVLGSFCVVDTVVRVWTAEHERILATLAAAATAEIALRDAAVLATNATLEAQDGLRRLAFMADASHILAATDDAEQAVGLLADHIVSLLCDWCVITIVDEGTDQPRDIGRAHHDPAMAAAVCRYAEQHLLDADAPSAQVIRTGRPVIALEPEDELVARTLPDALSRAAVVELKPAAAAIYPLHGRGQPFGAIALVNGMQRGPFSAVELNTAQELARRAGLSLENARLHSQQRRIADVLQASLLTDPPQVAGLDIAVRYRPATEDAQVGGDWYDVFQQPDDSTMLVIGDVLGHDLNAITMMGQIRTMVRSIGFDRAAGPAELLGRVDEAIAGLGMATLCTAQVLRLRTAVPGGGSGSGSPVRPGDVVLTWSSAGHPTPMIVHPDGTVEDLNARPDLLLGVSTSAPRIDRDAVLPAGATLLLMTDGLFERRDLSYDDSLHRVRQALSPLAGRSLEDFCDRLLDVVVPARPEDDIAIIAIRAGL